MPQSSPKRARDYDVAPPPRRCCLSVPASSPRKLEKAAGLDVDEIVLDLEDAVLPGAKADARAAAVAALEGEWAAGSVAVRVNAPRSPWCHLDLAALAAAASGRRLSVVLPKVEGAGDLAFADRLLDGAEAAAGRSRPIGVQALVESAAGLAGVAELAAASPRLEALILGYADLGSSLGRAADAPPQAWIAAQDAVLVAARAAGAQAIDGPYLALDTGSGFVAAAEHAVRQGFDGKWAIHPSQAAALTAAFTPSPSQVERARAVLAALDGAAAGAVELDGEMVDEAMRAGAERVLARAGEAA